MESAMFENLSGLESFFLFFGVIGGGLFTLRAVLIFLGLGGDDVVEDMDPSAMDGADVPAADFKMVSVHSLTAFFMMFGLTGFLILRNYGKDKVLEAGIASVAVGVLTMYIIAKLFSFTRKLQSDGTIHLSDAVGAEGSVYLEIRPGEIGKVQVGVKGASKVFDARGNDAAEKYSTGDHIVVLRVEDVLVVDRKKA